MNPSSSPNRSLNPTRGLNLYSTGNEVTWFSSTVDEVNELKPAKSKAFSISAQDQIYGTSSLKSRFSTHEASSEKDDSSDFTLVLPSNRMYIVIPGLMLSIFLSALDQTVITTAIPTIVANLDGGSSYSWIGTAYTLAQTSILPFCGIMSEVVGRKIVLYTSIVLFLFGSAMCGAAQNMLWLVLCRAVQGIGGGGITSLVTIVIADITPLQTRPYYTGCMGVTWGLASVMGPLIGGAISQKASWRWIFFINLPTGGLSLALLIFFLNLVPKPTVSFRVFLRDFDFVGIITITTGVVLFLVGLNIGSTTGHWAHANVLCYLIFGILCIAGFVVNEFYTTRTRIITPSAFKTLSLTSVMVTSFLHYYIVSTITYYIPVYFQNIKGDGPLMSGVHTLSLAVVSSLLSAVSGMGIGKLKNYRYPMIGGWIVLLAGTGSMIAIYYNTDISRTMGFLALTAVGTGNLFQPNLIAVQASVPPALIATSCSAFMLLRNMGASVGISMGAVIYDQQLTTLLKGTKYSAGLSYSQIASIPNVSEKNFVFNAYANAIRMIWIVNCPVAGVGMLLSFFTKQEKLSQSVTEYKEKDKGFKDAP
ncbi:basic amino acid transmembrane transporter [Schizosaccharomyces pombe]|uniref:Uncharacterized transporter C3H1.06c n=1 Tax=Schizosaccharomyces pombe (strain 972 / ATCC 24843) TaxID=284812 RepID=YAN6_SCHPO|nr:putative transporter [Schizosaccharomyces pombe]Q10072.1 RecName: Full=Uncharacterized transporter C3H1.06c [Schizosaccharomyces pombe 972h-]CAA92259.1 membrane transporter (predicted) [Schizosaccharomyces pombe]|eukprot:NP_593548.1 putative transporter [Schizosaccharomyces pombe]